MGENGQGTNLADYQRFARRQWWVVLLVVYLALVAAFAYLQVAPRTYKSTASVLVLPVDVDSSGNTITSASGKSTVNVDTEAQLVVSAPVVSEAITHMQGVQDPREVTKNVGVTAPVNTSILQIAYRAGTPADAQQGAQAFADAYLAVRLSQAESAITTSITGLQKQARTLSTQLKTASDQVAAVNTSARDRSFAQARQAVLSSQLSNLQSRITSLQSASTNPGNVIQKAALATSPVAPVRVLVLAAGLALGLLLGLGVGFLRHHLDGRVRSVDDVERRAGLEVLATVPALGRHSVRGPIGSGTIGRAYRQLHNVLVPQLSDVDQKGCVLLVSRASVGSSSQVVAELAVATSRAGTMVSVLSSDLQSSSLPELLDVPSAPGLVDVLLGERRLSDVIHVGTPTSDLSVVTAGEGGPEYSDLLESTTMRSLVDELRTSSEALFIEAPSTAAGADAQTLAIQADFVLLAAERGVSTLKHLSEAQRQFQRAGTTVLGVVLLPHSSRRERRASRSAAPTTAATTATSMTPATGSTATSATADGAAATTAGTELAPDVVPARHKRRLLRRAGVAHQSADASR
jgi:capsular polysaccharide biosynthesis protein